MSTYFLNVYPGSKFKNESTVNLNVRFLTNMLKDPEHQITAKLTKKREPSASIESVTSALPIQKQSYAEMLKICISFLKNDLVFK
jgi:hypothetical protein